MANGSLRTFLYETDGGTSFWYVADEGWTEAIIAAGGAPAGSADYTVISAVDFAMPANVEPRKVALKSADGKRRVEVICPTLDIFNALSNTGTFTAVDPANPGSNTLRLSYKKGERITFPSANDTGLDDGDNP